MEELLALPTPAQNQGLSGAQFKPSTTAKPVAEALNGAVPGTKVQNQRSVGHFTRGGASARCLAHRENTALSAAQLVSAPGWSAGRASGHW